MIRNRNRSTDDQDETHSTTQIQSDPGRAVAVRLVFSRYADPSVPPTEALLRSAHAELLTTIHEHDECH